MSMPAPSTKKIPVSGPWITEKEIRYVTDAAATAWFDNANVFHQRFERAFAEYLGVKHAVTLPSCTSALHLSLAALQREESTSFEGSTSPRSFCIETDLRILFYT